jgi:hypothetical protein
MTTWCSALHHARAADQGFGSHARSAVLEIETQVLAAGQCSTGHELIPHVETLPQIRRQRRAPPWIGLQTVSGGQAAVSPSSLHGVVQ